MIPKKIHYCWFGHSELPDLAKQCILSWQKYCPDYEIIEWNEKNYDVYKNEYIKEAYQNEKWAFVSDFARLDIIYSQGGFYLDTDVELIKSLDSLRNEKCVLGIETSNYINTGLGFGAEQFNDVIKIMLQEYDKVHFYISRGIYNDLPCPIRNTMPFIKYGFNKNSSEVQIILNAKIYPTEFFCPLDYQTGELKITDNTISIHHFDGTWIPKFVLEYEKYINNNKIKKTRINCIIYKNYFEYKSIYQNFNIINVFIFIFGKIKKKVLKFKNKNYYNI